MKVKLFIFIKDFVEGENEMWFIFNSFCISFSLILCLGWILIFFKLDCVYLC